MHRWKMLVMFVALAAIAAPVIAAPVPQAGRGSAAIGPIQYGSIEGRVVAVDLAAKTIRVIPTEGAATSPMSVAFTDHTVIHQGMLHRKASDIQVGEHVGIMYAGPQNRWVADNVNVLESPVAEAHYHGTR